MTITISPSAFTLSGPLVAGGRVGVSISGFTFAEGVAPVLTLQSRFPAALLASVQLAADEQTSGTWTGELDTATKQTAAFMLTARADERRDALLELVAGRESLARLAVPLVNSALCPKLENAPDASPVYIPVPGPPGEPRKPSNATPSMDGTGAAGSATTYARGDHVHPTDTSRAADSAVVKLTGDQTVDGHKTFSNQVAAADFLTSYSFSFTGGKFVSAPENSGATLTDADLADNTTALGAALAAKADSADLATVATTGAYSDLIGTPTIPSTPAQVGITTETWTFTLSDNSTVTKTVCTVASA